MGAAADPAADSDLQRHLHRAEVCGAAQVRERRSPRIGRLAASPNYQSGAFLAPPTSPTANFLTSEDVRVPASPCTCKTSTISTATIRCTNVVLNPRRLGGRYPQTAWDRPRVHFTAISAARVRPTENAKLRPQLPDQGEHYDLYIRAEFVNIFNRTILPNPSTSNPQNRADQRRGRRNDPDQRVRSDQRLQRTRHAPAVAPDGDSPGPHGYGDRPVLVLS